MPLTPDTLRQEILDGLDKALTSRLLLRFLTDEQIKLLKAQRSFWAQADPAALQTLLTIYDSTSA